MSQQKLTYTIILMSIALLGLVALQFYWLNTAVKLGEESFKQSVLHILDNVAKRLEYREALYIARENVDRQVGKETFIQDSAGRLYWKGDQVITTKQILSSQDLESRGLEIELQEKSVISKSGMASQKFVTDTLSISFQPEKMQPVFDSLQYLKEKQNQKYLKLANKSRMVSVILQNWANFDKPIEERIDYHLLDSLLREEVAAMQIDIPYEFGIVDIRRKTLIYADSSQDKSTLLQSGLRIKLFPNDEYAADCHLYVHFPDRRQYILRNMTTVLSSSVLLIMIVTLCFGIAIFTIIRQKKLSEMTTDFINNMTHEFKTPVSTIALACEMMQDSDIRRNEQLLARYLLIVKDENERLGMQVEKVLQIAALEKGDFKLRIQPIDIHEVIDRAIQNIAIQIENRNGLIQTEFKAEKSMIEADEMHVMNMVTNLLDNANKYSPDVPDITVLTENSDKGVILTISDRGQGIAQETISKVFDKFYRVPTGNVHNVKGFGLGLSYVKTMVQAHRGSISVNSELNKGTTFFIFLPFKHEGN
jgi:two-component system, OmpR family, phosphate regulon sensor histidine kinase PhoR